MAANRVADEVEIGVDGDGERARADRRMHVLTPPTYSSSGVARIEPLPIRSRVKPISDPEPSARSAGLTRPYCRQPQTEWGNASSGIFR